MNTKKGFTLIELLVVIAIISLLAAIVITNVASANKKGRDTRRISDIKELQLALELYYDSNSTYPLVLSTLAPTFISTIPNDPLSNLPYAYVALAGASADVTVCASYHLGARLEDSTSIGLTSDADASPGGTYPTGDGTKCTGSSWAGNTDIPTTAGDFAGTDPIFDVRQ